MFKVCRVNTKSGNVIFKELKEEYKLFGNRGLVAKVLTDEVDPKCDPLGSENKIIISTGMLAGTPVSTAHRLSVGGKSPLTGGIKEANAGGTVAYQLARHGIKMIILDDKPEDDCWKILRINAQEEAELLPADEYIGLNNYDLVDELYSRFGSDIAVMSIGTAGERLANISSLQITDLTSKHPSRAAARGGLGAVTGSKKIKAIVIEKAATKHEFPYADKEAFNAANKKLIEFCTMPDSPVAGFGVSGTIMVTDITAPTGILPVNNFTASLISPEQLEKISANAWVDRANKFGGKTGAACQPGCLVRCSNVYKNKKGDTVTSGLEYETYAMLGPNLDIFSIDFVAEADRICDNLGVDTIDVGNILAVLMDCGQIPWGDEEKAKDALMQMVEGKTELGKLMLQGVIPVCEKFGAKRIPAVKRQGLAAYDPRNAKGMGVTYSTSPMGADHTAGYAIDFGATDGHKKEGKVEFSKTMQIIYTTTDNMACAFLLPFTVGETSVFSELIQGAYGGEWDLKRLLSIGEKTMKMEKEWNDAAGFTTDMDCLPDFMYNESSPATGATFDITTEEMQKIFIK